MDFYAVASLRENHTGWSLLRWRTEATTSHAVLSHLTAAEADLYCALQRNVHGPSVRLKQELLRWDWVESRLPASGATK
ncbi:Wadjet anti-phage system protein JetD domain-containing protein [Arthrobacter pityocampae]|uniref:Wadjet anti-phage system protein JetD domain-containing protein n=1 Tax=Arthrobacter pityocampae TaxID=547334 RepID=UPI003736515E